MGSYSSTYLYIDFAILLFIAVALAVGNVLWFVLVTLNHRRQQYMATLDRLLVGMDANQSVALVDIFGAVNDGGVEVMNTTLKNASEGDSGVLYTLVFDTFSEDGSLTDVKAENVTNMSMGRIAGLKATVRNRIDQAARSS